MFYIQVVRQNRGNKTPSTSKPSEVETRNEKSSKFAKAKTTEYISNTQQIYYLERRLFG
jgi:hypothetical protein